MTTPENESPQDPYAQNPENQNPTGQSPPPNYGQVPPQQPYGQVPGQQPYGQVPPQNYGQMPPQQPLSPQDERTWAAASHWGPLVVGLVTCGSLFWAVPLIIMLVQGKRSGWVRANAVESLNFQISVLIYSMVSVVLAFFLVGLLTGAAVLICWVVFGIVATGKANNGEPYRYPLTLRLVS